MIGKRIAKGRKEKNISRKRLAELLNIPVEMVKWWENSGKRPDKDILPKIAALLDITHDELLLSSGEIPKRFQPLFEHHPHQLLAMFERLSKTYLPEPSSPEISPQIKLPSAALTTDLGQLYHRDCLSILPLLAPESVDCIFADPPFNLGKDYGSKIDDKLAQEAYLAWSFRWIDESIRVLKPGGSFFLYNIPKWNIHLSQYLTQFLEFKHWISIDIKFSLPISGRLYPSHYALLYFIKGKKANHFSPPRLPLPSCRHCGGELKDYGGHKHRMNPAGVNLTDVWLDIPPVRHKRYKNRSANELSIKMLDRVLDIATQEGDIVLDPFGGAGTTFVACELNKRRWIGCEIGDIQPIIRRLKDKSRETKQLEHLRQNSNTLFTKETLRLRAKFGHDTSKYNFDVTKQKTTK